MGTHYTPEELGAEVDAEGELIQATAEQLRPADPDWASKPATAQPGDEGDALALARIELATVELTLRDGRQITMLGEPTETSQLWITPTVDQHDGRWSGNCLRLDGGAVNGSGINPVWHADEFICAGIYPCTPEQECRLCSGQAADESELRGYKPRPREGSAAT